MSTLDRFRVALLDGQSLNDFVLMILEAYRSANEEYCLLESPHGLMLVLLNAFYTLTVCSHNC